MLGKKLYKNTLILTITMDTNKLRITHVILRPQALFQKNVFRDLFMNLLGIYSLRNSSDDFSRNTVQDFPINSYNDFFRNFFFKNFRTAQNSYREFFFFYQKYFFV